MMKKLLLLSFAFSVGCTVNNNSTNDGGFTPGADDTGVAPGTDGSSSDSPGSDDGTGADSSVTDDSSTPSDGSTTETGTGMATSCGAGSLFAGNPLYDGMPLDRPATGTGILADPPFQWQNLVFANGWLFSRDEGELWGVDMSASAKVEKRIVGANHKTDANYSYSDGPCASARFSRIEGLAMLPDKSLVVADSLANGILHVTNPTTSACAVEYWAGNKTANLDYDPFMAPPNEGDVNGPGASAKLNTPGALVVDDAGNVYFYDQGNHKIKKIANDVAHTVSTLVAVPTTGAADKIPNLTRIGGKIYGAGFDASNAYVFSVDIATGTLTNLVKSFGGAEFDPADPGRFLQLSGITTDGTGLIVSGAGYVWYVTTAGVVSHLAGKGPNIDYWDTGYDPKASHPAKDLWLPPARSSTSIGSADYITYFEGALYVRAHADGTAAFIEKISCP
ncbi:MAG: hypothetical protein ACXVEE_06695 [Polyangiales bacterium]